MPEVPIFGPKYCKKYLFVAIKLNNPLFISKSDLYNIPVGYSISKSGFYNIPVGTYP